MMVGLPRRFLFGTLSTREELERQLRAELGHISRDQAEEITRAIGQATRVIMAKLADMEKRMRTLEETLALVESQTSKVDSLIALTTDLHQKVIDALGATITPSQQMRIDQVFDEVKASADEIDAAITANTIAATAGAVTGGPSAAEIGVSINQPPPNPAPAPASTDPAASGT